MPQQRIGWFHLLIGAALGLLALLAEEAAIQLMGAVALVVTAGLLLSRRRGTKSEPGPGPPEQIPELSWAERLLPWLFLAVTLLVVLALTLYTLNQLGGGP